MIRHEAFDLLLLITCAYALRFGGSAERLVGAALGIADILSVLLVSDRVHRFHQEEVGLLAIDTVLLVVLYVVALRSTRWWPLILAGLQIDSVAAHLMHLLAPHVLPVTYMNAIALWAWPMALLLLAGTWRHQQRRAYFGDDPSWKSARTAALDQPGIGDAEGRPPRSSE